MELFDFTFFHSQMFWLVLCFVVLLIFMQKFAVPAISKSLDDRATQIKQDLQDAQKLKKDAEELLADYNAKMHEASKEVDRVLAKAKSDAKKLAEKESAELEEKLQARAKKATAAIETAKNKAAEELKEQAYKLVVTATEKLVLESVDSKKAKALTAKAIKDIEK